MALLDFVGYIRQTLARYSPTAANKGTSIDFLAVKPVGLLLSDVNNNMNSVVSLEDIAQSQTWTDDQVAAYGSRNYMPWIKGRLSSGYVRVYVNQPQQIQVQTATAMATSRQGLTFVPVRDTVISRLEFTFDQSRALYWVDIGFVASGYGSNYNVLAGSITRVDGLGLNYQSVTNPEDFVDGSPGESRDQYLQRLAYADADKSCLGYRSIKAGLQQNFPAVNSVYVAGAGDQYMTRDSVPIPGSTDLKTSFLGKTPGIDTVPHTAYRDVFPPEPDSQTKTSFGSLQPVSAYKFPVAVVSVDYLNSDPALRGFRLNREFNQDDYSGVYFDDGMTGSGVKTANTVDFSQEPGFSPISPDPSWYIGDQGLDLYTFDKHSISGTPIPAADVVSLSNSQLTIQNGDGDVYSYASKDVYRNSGLVVRGRLQVSADVGQGVGAEHVVMIGAQPDSNVFSGLGFGLKKLTTVPSTNTNKWVFFISHNSKQASSQVFMRPGDQNTAFSMGDISTLAEHFIDENIIQTTTDVWFSMTVDSDFNVSVILVDNSTGLQIDAISIGGGVAKSILNTISSNPGSFGTMVRFYGLCRGANPIVFSDVVVRDTNPRWPTALMLFDTTGFEAPVRLTVKARGNGSVNGVNAYGYSVNIWDNESPVVTANIAGGWTPVPELGDSSQQQTGFYQGETLNIYDLSRYACTQLGSNILAVVITSSQPSCTATAYGSEDIDAEIDLDFIKIEDVSDINLRQGNAIDLYVNTYSNSQNRSLITISVQASNGVIVLDPAEPVMSVVTVSGADNGTDITANIQVVATPTESSPYRTTVYLPGSTDSGLYNLTYAPFYAISEIQAFFNSKQYGSAVGGIRVLHKNPVDIDLTWVYTGTQDVTSVDSAIRTYVDARPDGVFDLIACYQFLNGQGLVSSLDPSTVLTYVDPETLTQTQGQRAVIRDIDFFRLNTIQVIRL